MSDINKQSLSALLDNEADDLELRRLLKSSAKDSELTRTWERYNLVQALLHHDAVPVKPGLSQRISEQLAQEPALVPAQRPVHWQQHLAKLAIAASVAAVFFMAVQTNLNSDPSPALAQQSAAPATPLATEIVAPSLLADTNSTPVDPAEVQQILLDYLSSMTLDESKPVYTEHIKDSPLFRLVNDLQAKP